MLTLSDFELSLLIAGPFVALLGHGSIAWEAIKKFFKNAVARIDKRADEVDARVAAIEAKLDSFTAPTFDVEELSKKVADAVGDVDVEDIVEKVVEGLKAWMEGVRGGAAKSADAKIAPLLATAIQTGNPMFDTAWALAPNDLKKAFLTKAARLLRQSTAQELGIDVTEEVAISPSEPWYTRQRQG